MSMEDVFSILGKPDIVTTRENLQAQIYPRPVDKNRYKDKFEFWIYYQHPSGRNDVWGFVEFDKQGTVVDVSIQAKGQRPQFDLEMQIPDKEMFKKIGGYTGDDWNLMPDKSKVLLTIDIIDSLRGKDVFIEKNPFFYVEELDYFFKDGAHKHFTVLNTLYCFAVLNKDWDDGLDRDERIRRILPSDLWSDFTE